MCKEHELTGNYILLQETEDAINVQHHVNASFTTHMSFLTSMAAALEQPIRVLQEALPALITKAADAGKSEALTRLRLSMMLKEVLNDVRAHVETATAHLQMVLDETLSGLPKEIAESVMNDAGDAQEEELEEALAGQ